MNSDDDKTLKKSLNKFNFWLSLWKGVKRDVNMLTEEVQLAHIPPKCNVSLSLIQS